MEDRSTGAGEVEDDSESNHVPDSLFFSGTPVLHVNLSRPLWTQALSLRPLWIDPMLQGLRWVAKRSTTLRMGIARLMPSPCDFTPSVASTMVVTPTTAPVC